MALAVVVGADQHRHVASDVDPHRRTFEDAGARAERLHDARWRQAAGFDIGAKPDAAQLAAPLGGFLAFGEAAPVGDLQRLGETGLRVTAVVINDHRRLVGILRRVDHVPAADFRLVDLHLAGGDVDQPLEQEGRLGTTGTAISIHGHGVGEDAFDLAMNCGRGVDAGKQQAVEIGRDVRSKCRQVAAHVGDGAHLQSEKLSVLVQGQFGFADMVAAVGVGQEALAPLVDPLHRPIHFARRPGGDDLLGIDELLDAETATDIGRNDPNAILVEAQHFHDEVAGFVGELC